MTELPVWDRESVCPVCLQRIPARLAADGDVVSLVKQCPEHGEFSTPVWRGEPVLDSWIRAKIPSRPKHPATDVDKGCPYDCGLCHDHRQHTCTAVIEITSRCNLGCPVCFASSGKDAGEDTPTETVQHMLESVMQASGTCNIQFSGGEPTVRDDLPELVTMAKDMGFPFVQVNTNGLRFAREPEFAQELAEAGLDSAFFQFDGTTDDIFEKLRGRKLLGEKLVALDRLIEAGIGVVLVPTVVPGVNEKNLGLILSLAACKSPGVRGVHFQPVSYFGRYPESPAPESRITLPEVMRLLEEQTGGQLRAADFVPPGCEHYQCSFHANYMVGEDGALKRISTGLSGCDCSPGKASDGADKAKGFVSRQWAAPEVQLLDKPQDDLDRFISRAKSHTLAVSAMAFQDAWTLDLDRLRGCCIHEVTRDGRLVPFCAFNLTSMDGRTLYRGRK